MGQLLRLMLAGIGDHPVDDAVGARLEQISQIHIAFAGVEHDQHGAPGVRRGTDEHVLAAVGLLEMDAALGATIVVDQDRRQVDVGVDMLGLQCQHLAVAALGLGR